MTQPSLAQQSHVAMPPRNAQHAILTLTTNIPGEPA